MTIVFRKIMFLAIVAALAVILAACKPGDLDKLYGGGESDGEATEEALEKDGDAMEAKPSVTITATDDAFSPSSAAVESGGTITWTNETSKEVQIGSANHPTHTVNKEITGDEFVIKIEAGDSETVTVSKTGDWGYHNHLKPSIFGKVTVK